MTAAHESVYDHSKVTRVKIATMLNLACKLQQVTTIAMNIESKVALTVEESRSLEDKSENL